MRIKIKGQEVSEPVVEFSLRQDTPTSDVDIYANDDLIGWFHINPDKKIVFIRSFPSKLSTKEAFKNEGGIGFLVVQDN